MEKDYRPPLSLSETAHALGTTEQVVRRALLRGELKGFKVGREWRITRETVERKLDGEAVCGSWQ
jgi:excisionase family DNA binding protein